MKFTARRRGLKLLVAGTAVVASVAMVAGCSSSKPNSSSSGGGGGGGVTKLAFWARADDKDFVNALVDSFNKTHTNIQVITTIVPNNSFQQKLGTSVGTSAAPDITAIDDVLAPYFASQGAFVDVTDQAKALSYFSDLNKAQMNQGTYQGKIFAIPFASDTSVMFWNKDLFQKAGLDPDKGPASWDELKADSIAVSKLGPDYTGFYFSGDCGGCAIFNFGPLVWASGGDVLDQASGNPNPNPKFDSDEVVGAVQLWNDMYKAGAIPKSAQADNGANYGGNFQAGQLGIVFSGSFEYSTYMQQKPAFDIGVGLIPGKTAGQGASFAGGDVIAIPNGTKHEAEAWEFLKWVTDTEAQTQLADAGFTPVRTDLFDSIYSPKGEAYATMAQASLNGFVPYSTQEYALINGGNSPFIGLMQDGVFGNDVPSAAAAAQKAGEQIVAQGG